MTLRMWRIGSSSSTIRMRLNDIDAPPRGAGILRARRRFAALVLRDAKAQCEHRAALVAVRRADRAAERFHQAMADRQAEARALARRLGREERIEQPRQIRWRDAGAVVGDRELDRLIDRTRFETHGALAA